MDARTFGNYLSRMRKAQGLTQAELAERLHVTDKASAAGNGASVCRISTHWNRWQMLWG